MPRTKVKIDDDVISKTGPSSSSSGRGGMRGKPQFHLQTTLGPTDTLIDELSELGFDGAAAFILRFEPERIKRAIARAKSHPPGKIKNLAGYIRYLVTTPGPIPEPQKSPSSNNKYISGKYGHMVKK